ncbi:GIY-YIG nuclease family protein [Cupriavidus alkaliphilus]|uniref:Stalled ribosome alternative rescue factor ArfA n=1 Tax=Cupriavidus alkaliphilus TaxID=942866 RepID=A0A7W4VFG3_9BURK|nr:GIY-YIG nuclease family protein [Cupriavidus alkaliphilus]MBB3010642.1 stalled ribosome alternative rescue factor ArfA [Cupriavidus alkaliphilus]
MSNTGQRPDSRRHFEPDQTAPPVSIYVLTCPETGEIRYVGKANDPAARLKSHLRDARRRSTPVYCWIRSLAERGLAPKMSVLCLVPADEWEVAERRTIAACRRQGCRLLNLAEGGDQPSQTKAQRAGAGRRAAKAVHSDPLRKRIWELKKGLGSFLKFAKDEGRHDSYERIASKLRIVAAKRPDLFGEWATL